MVVYTVDKGEYITVTESMRRQPKGKRSVYVNLTNRCTCACTFCLRQLKDMDEGTSLWLKEEPTADQVETLLEQLPWAYVKEVVFCGFGEPTMRLDMLVQLLAWVKQQHPAMPTRLNTNGLSDLAYGYDTAAAFSGGILDTISISLNASNAERYLALTHSKFGLASYEAMLKFASNCQKHIANVVLTVVDQVEDAAEIEACRKICDLRGLKLRVRPYEAN